MVHGAMSDRRCVPQDSTQPNKNIDCNSGRNSYIHMSCIISTIKKNHQYFGHYHTAGVPGRNELDKNQELYYPAIMDAILSTGFTGYVAQEFIPKGKDPIKSLEDAVILCDV